MKSSQMTNFTMTNTRKNKECPSKGKSLAKNINNPKDH